MFWNKLKAENKELRERIDIRDRTIKALEKEIEKANKDIMGLCKNLAERDEVIRTFENSIEYRHLEETGLLQDKIANQRKEITRLLGRLSVGSFSLKQKAIDKEVNRQWPKFAEARREMKNLHNQIKTYQADIKALSEDNEALRKELLGNKKSSARRENRPKGIDTTAANPAIIDALQKSVKDKDCDMEIILCPICALMYRVEVTDQHTLNSLECLCGYIFQGRYPTAKPGISVWIGRSVKEKDWFKMTISCPKCKTSKTTVGIGTIPAIELECKCGYKRNYWHEVEISFSGDK